MLSPALNRGFYAGNWNCRGTFTFCHIDVVPEDFAMSMKYTSPKKRFSGLFKEKFLSSKYLYFMGQSEGFSPPVPLSSLPLNVPK